MNTSNNKAHLAIGFALGIALTLVMGATSANGNRSSNGEIGRFQISVSSDTGEAFIVDTITGRAWTNRRVVVHREFFEPKLGL